MKKLFISQPMRDKTDKEIKAERAKIVEAVTERFGEVEVIDSFFESAPHDAKPLWFLGKSLELLWNYFQLLMLLILQRVGKITEVARLNMNVLCSMALIL